MNTDKTIRRIVSTPDGFDLVNDIEMVDAPKSIVVMCHGINSHKLEYLDLFPRTAALLLRNNVASCRFDFRGHGESSGETGDFNVISQIIDVYSIVNDLKNAFQLHNVSISFFGVSFGAAPGILADPNVCPFEKICMFAPVISYRDTFINPSTDWAKRSFNAKAFEQAQRLGHLVLDGNFNVSLALIEQMKLIDPEVNLSTTNVDVRLYHGSRDTSVPVAPAERLLGVNKNVDIIIVDGMEHGLHLHGDDNGESEASKQMFKTVTDEITQYFSS